MERKTWRSVGIRWSIMLIAACSGQGVETVSPSQVIDIRGIVRAATLRKDFLAARVAQSSGRWVASVIFNDRKSSILVAGGGREAPIVSEPLEGVADEVAIDPSGQVSVRLRGGGSIGEIQMRDAALRLTHRQRMKTGTTLEVVPSGQGALWLEGGLGGEVFTVAPGTMVHAGRLGGSPAPAGALAPPPDYRELLALSSGRGAPRWIAVEHLSEQVSVFENNGARLATNRIDLDDAYVSAGLQIPARDRIGGRSLITWVVASRAGALYVCISSVPYGRPTPLAVIDPFSGSLGKVLSVVLPSSAERVDQYNPQGYMYPGTAAMDDQLVILDRELGLLAVYDNF